jgi:hypothetical protein
MRPDGVAGAVARRRGRLLLVGAAVVGAGLASRRWPLPGVFAEYTGDALYVVLVHVGLAFVRPAARPGALFVAAWSIGAAIEASQAIDWPWLRELRAGRIGALLLGQGFQWQDLVAQAVGAGLAFAVDAAAWRRSALDHFRRGCPRAAAEPID